MVSVALCGPPPSAPGPRPRSRTQSDRRSL